MEHGGITAVATAAGVSTATVSRGLHQLRGSMTAIYTTEHTDHTTHARPNTPNATDD